MQKILNYIFIIFLILGFSSCLKLDSMLYNPYETDEYLLDDFEFDNPDYFNLDASYDIDPNLIHLFVLPTSTSEPIYAVYVGDTNQISTDTIIMYNHGNTGHLDYYWKRVKLLANAGGKNRFGILMIDYQGYGMSGGTPSEENLYQDVNDGLKWLKQKGLTSDRLVMYGFSMGTAPSCKLTASPRALTPSKLILEAPFASAEVMIQDGSQLQMPGTYLTDLKIDNAEEIKNVTQPLLWIHGTEDDFIARDTHGLVVYNNHSGSYRKAVKVDGGEHGTCPQTLGFNNYNSIILDFITQ